MRKFIYGLVRIFAISSLIFTSCDNFNGSNILEPICANNSESASTETSASKADMLSGQAEYVTLSGSINTGSAVPKKIAQAMQISNTENDENSSRSAFPSIPTTGITYSVTAVNTATGSTESYTGEVLTDDGNVTYRVGIPATETEKNYKVKVSVRLSGFEREYVILSGQSDEFSISSDKPVESKNITLKPESNNGSGILNLSVDVTGTEIKSAVATVNFSSNERAYIYGVLNDNQLIFKTGEHTDDELADGLSSGAWSVIFEFYKTTNRTGEKVYSFNEIVSIFENLTTDTWVQNGDEPRFVTTTDASGKKTTICRITSAMLERDKLTDIYVDSSRSTTSGAANYTTESGTFLNPCLKLINATKKLNNKETDYTVYIKGTLSGYSQIESAVRNDDTGTYQAKTLTVCSATGLNENGIPQDVLNGNGTICCLNVMGRLPVTLKNLAFTNGYEAGSWPGGIFLQGTNDTVLENCIITSCSGGSTGGGIKITSSRSLTMVNSTISECSAPQGGAVYVGGTFKMKGSAYIPAGVDGVTGAGKNDVYLPTGTTIKIAGKLTPPAACTDGIVATITPASYTAGTQLIELDTGVTDTSLAEAAAHFAVTPDADGQMWGIDSEGKLIVWPYIGTKAPETPKEVGDIVFNDGSSMPYSAYENLTTEKKNAKKTSAIALIYYKGTGLNDGSDTTTVRTLGVGLKHARKNWCDYQVSAHYLKVSPLESDKINGSNGLTLISEFLKANGKSDDTGYAVKYPAFYYCKNYKLEKIGSETESRIPSGSEFESGWYLPTYDEIRQIYINGVGDNKKFDINTASKALGGSEFSNTYNTATQWSLKDYDDRYSFIYLMIFSGSNAGTSMNGSKYGGSGTGTCAIREF